MNRFFKTIVFLIVYQSFISCSILESTFMNNSNPFIENFDNYHTFQKNWVDNSWKSPALYQLENNHLKITTRSNTQDRVKIRSKQKFTTGSYNWRIFIPEFILFEQVSIGAFLYHNQQEEFEFDFEIGSGQKSDREKIKVKDNEAIVFCVSQFSPSNSSYFPIKMGEYANFKMDLTDVNGFYLVKWYINDQLVKSLQTEVKSDIKFKAHCSLENLFFMGDVPTTQETIVLFDSFNYQK